jgi:hypothetical protein
LADPEFEDEVISQFEKPIAPGASLYDRCKKIIDDEAVRQRGTGAYQYYLKLYPPKKLCKRFPKSVALEWPE